MTYDGPLRGSKVQRLSYTRNLTSGRYPRVLIYEIKHLTGMLPVVWMPRESAALRTPWRLTNG